MAKPFLTEEEIKKLVDAHMRSEGKEISVQEILNAGEIPELKGFIVRPGKVSDCIFGGEGSFIINEEEHDRYMTLLSGLNIINCRFFDTKDKNGKLKTKIEISFMNPPLKTATGKHLFIPVRSERVSTHDKKRGKIPLKDQVLALNHHFMLNLVKGVIGTSQFDIPDLGPTSIILAGEKLTQIGFENVMRRFMAKSSTETSMYHHYINKGLRLYAGHLLSEDLYPNCELPYIMDTPSTKDAISDLTVEPGYLFQNKICSPYDYAQIRNSSINSFVIAQLYLLKMGLILVDTKTEHGFNNQGKIVSQDELYNLDSSRIWLMDDYSYQRELYLEKKEKDLIEYLKGTQPDLKEKDYILNGRVIMSPKSYSKEFARGFSVEDNEYTNEQRAIIAVRYIESIQKVLNTRFEPDTRPRHERIISGIKTVLKNVT